MANRTRRHYAGVFRGLVPGALTCRAERVISPPVEYRGNGVGGGITRRAPAPGLGVSSNFGVGKPERIGLYSIQSVKHIAPPHEVEGANAVDAALPSHSTLLGGFGVGLCTACIKSDSADIMLAWIVQAWRRSRAKVASPRAAAGRYPGRQTRGCDVRISS